MNEPISFTELKSLIEANVLQRFRIQFDDKNEIDNYLREYRRKFIGRWGYVISDNSLIIGIEDEDDKIHIKKKFYKSYQNKIDSNKK